MYQELVALAYLNNQKKLKKVLDLKDLLCYSSFCPCRSGWGQIEKVCGCIHSAPLTFLKLLNINTIKSYLISSGKNVNPEKLDPKMLVSNSNDQECCISQEFIAVYDVYLMLAVINKILAPKKLKAIIERKKLSASPLFIVDNKTLKLLSVSADTIGS